MSGIPPHSFEQSASQSALLLDANDLNTLPLDNLLNPQQESNGEDSLMGGVPNIFIEAESIPSGSGHPSARSEKFLNLQVLDRDSPQTMIDTPSDPLLTPGTFVDSPSMSLMGDFLNSDTSNRFSTDNPFSTMGGEHAFDKNAFGSAGHFPGRKNESDSDSDSLSSDSDDSNELFNVDKMLRSRKDVSSSLNPFMSKLLSDVQLDYNDYNTMFADESLKKDDELAKEAIIIKDIDVEILEKESKEVENVKTKMQTQQLIEQEANQTLEDLRKIERHTRENIAINRVKRSQRYLILKEQKNDIMRRHAYKELSDSARHFFKKQEDLVKMKLEKKRAVMLPSQDHLQVQKKKWTLEWDREPQLIDVRICQVRGIGSSLPEGTYSVLISLWNRIGGYPLQFSKHNTKVKKSTREVYHPGQYDDVSTVFDDVIRMNGPAVVQVTPRMVFVFELLCLNRGTGAQTISMNKTVGWGVFPAVESNLRFVQGCFKCPLIKGDIDFTVDKHEQITKIMKKKKKFWLGNLYFEVKHSGVDRRIRRPEEYALEVKHSNAEEKENEEENRYQKKSLRYRSVFSRVKDLFSNPNATREASEFFRSTNNKKEVLIMEQQKVWFGDPEFSILKPIELESESESDDGAPLIQNQQDYNESEDMISILEDDEKVEEHPKIRPLEPALSPASRAPSVSSPFGSFPPDRSFNTGLLRQSMSSFRSGPDQMRSFSRASSRNLVSQRSRMSLRKSTSQRSVFGGNHNHDYDNYSNEQESEGDLFGKDEGVFFFDNLDHSESVTSSFRGNLTTQRQESQKSAPPSQIVPAQTASFSHNDSATNFNDTGDFAAQILKKVNQNTKKTIKDVKMIGKSLFKDIFELGGATRMDLNFYKQSVWRKKHSWGASPIYWEKLIYLRRSILTDLALHEIKSVEFFLMLLVMLIILVLRAYPHYLGHYIYLSLFRIPVITTDESNFYHMAFTFRGEFRTTAINFGYAVSGLVFNILLSCIMFLFTYLAQILFSQLPAMLYRLVFLFAFSVLLDPFLIAMVGIIFRDWEVDMFKLAKYFLITERSIVPGILITVALYVPLLITQVIVMYHYTLRIHMNRRTLDVYRRLHTREKDTVLPHDLEITYKEFKHICEEAKSWRGPQGHTRLVIISRIPLDARDSILLKRLDALLMCKKWPSDYLNAVMELEQNFNGDATTLLPIEILSSKSRPAVFLKENHFGKIFSIINFPAFADAILFDKFHVKEKKWRLLRMEKLLVEYHIISRGLIPRLRDGKLITGHIMNPDLDRADYATFTARDVEISSAKEAKHSGLKGLAVKAARKGISALETVRNTISKTVFKNEDEMLVYDDIHHDPLLEERKSKFPPSSKFCLHIQIYNQSLIRERTLYRHFVRCPSGVICEVFGKDENQETSTISNVESNDYWIRRARLEAEWRARVQAQREAEQQVQDLASDF